VKDQVMRAVIVGAGAIGVWMGERLSAAGWTVSALARGATLEALQTHGLRVNEKGETRWAPVIVSDDPAVLGPQDYLIISLKAQALPGLVERLAPLMHEKTAVVSAINGIPWWYFQGFKGPMENACIEAVDPGGKIAAAIAPERVIGCVLHNSNFSPEPGLAQVAGLDRLIFGEPDGGDSERVRLLAEAFRAANVRIDTPADIRLPIWAKLWGNMHANPLSALTGAGTADMAGDPLVYQLILRMMQEMSDIGDRLGLKLGISPEDRMAVARKLGNFRTSMLQDMEQGRPLELDPILGAVVELGDRLGMPTQNLSTVYGLTRLAAQMKGLYPKG
jgi:2-dehydropantoate 2-reductase